MKHVIILSAAILFLPLLGSAKDCDYSISLSNSTVQITDVDQIIQNELFVEHEKGSKGKRDCETYRVYFGKGLGNSYQRKAYSSSGRSINYNLHQQVNMAGILKEVGDALNQNEFIEGSAPNPSQRYQNSYYVSVPDIAEQNYPQSDSYRDTVQVSIYGYVDEKRDFVFEQSATLTLLFIVSDKVSISLIDEGGAFDASATAKVLDFGFLTQFQEKAVDLRVVSNTPYQVKASSTNNGRLRHTSLSATIGFGMKVNGTGIALGSSAGNPVTLGSGQQTSSSGDRFNLRFQILDGTTGLPAGLYQDQITITAIAN